MARHRTLLTCVLFSVITVILGNMLKRDVLDVTDLPRLCPYSNFCTTNSSKATSNDTVSCCLPCFCSEFCWARDDCCYDVTTPLPENIAELQAAVECMSDSYSFVGSRRSAIHTENTTYMWMITKCIGQMNGLAAKCALAPDSSILDLVPVWSPSTRDLYRNQYCAMCYDVTDYEFLSVDIGELNNYLNVEENVDWEVIDYLIRRHPNKAVLRVYASNGIRHQLSYCNITQDSQCDNDTQAGLLIRDRCFSVNLPYMSQEIDPRSRLRKVMYYKNIYCYLCSLDNHQGLMNQNSIYNDTHVRMNFKKDGCLSIKTVSTSGGGFVSFTEVIHFDGTIGHSRLTCGETEVLDSYVSKCRPLVCPELSLPYNGECYYIEGYVTPRTVSFLVTANTAAFPSLNVSNALALAMIFTWTKQSDADFICGVEVAYALSQSYAETRDSFISIGFQNNDAKKANTFERVRNVHRFLSSEVHLGANMNGSILRGVDARSYQYNEIWYPPGYNRTCHGSFKVIRVWCPTIELSGADFQYCVTHKVLPKDYEFNNPSTLAANQSVVRQICLQDYLHAWLNISRAVKLRMSSSLLLSAVLLFVLTV